MINESLKIKGMHCASCALNITSIVKKIDGVEECNVNYATEILNIKYNKNLTNIDQINSSIKKIGYSIIQKEKSENNELMDIKKNLYISIPMVGISFSFMIWEILSNYNLVNKIPEILNSFMHHLMPIFATYSLFVIGLPYLKSIYIFYKNKVANMNTLVGIGTSVAFLYSFIVSSFEELLSKYINTSQNYYDVTIIVIGFITLGKYLETKSKYKTGEAIKKLIGLQAKTALLKINGKTKKVLVEELKQGDTIIIKPGSKIPVDGIVIKGNSSVDESMITGEAMPATKVINSKVIGSTINKGGVLEIKATNLGSKSMLAQIIKMVEKAQSSQAPIQKMVDKISSVFVPIVFIIAIVALTTWISLAFYFDNFADLLPIAISAFIGVLVIACPCALGLATPTAIIVASGKGAENGILIKDAESLQKLNKVTTIVTDKTGTITNGTPKVTDLMVTSHITQIELLSIVASIENNSDHPLSIAIIEYAKQNKIKLQEVSNFKNIEGIGVSAEINGQTYYIGNKKLLDANNISTNVDIQEYTKNGKTPVFIMNKKELLGVLAIADTLKDNAKHTIDLLNKMGFEVILLTGDNKNTANYIAKKAGITQVIAEVLPNQKADIISTLQKNNKVVAMVGDGINDAPALAKADIGIAMATGSDIAIESANITLLNGDISKILKAVKLSKFTINAINQNLFWAFIYNIIGIPVAAGALYFINGVLLNPVFAGLAMAFSSVSVVTNSLRLKYKNL